MTRRKLAEKNIRKVTKTGNSYTVSIPIEIMKELGWREKQKVVVKKHGQGVLIKDWK